MDSVPDIYCMEQNNQPRKTEYMYNFYCTETYMATGELVPSSGWNTQWATSKEEAIELATKRWEDRPNLHVNPNTFRVLEQDDLDAHMSLFY